MSKKQRECGKSESPVIDHMPLACADEGHALEFLELLRWGADKKHGCPRCGSDDVYAMKDRKDTAKRNINGRWRCRSCGKFHTVRTGTVMEDSRIPLRVWCYAFWKVCSSKKGISALQIKREQGLSYKSALFLMHRVRFALSDMPGCKLTGDVEADETYVGGKPRPGTGYHKRGRGTKKQPVMAVVERNGEVRTKVIADVSAKTLGEVIDQNVDPTACLHTDEWKAYRLVGACWPGGHEIVRHGEHEYVRGNAYTNTAESFFALVKRGLYGTFHAVSKKHLHRYINEFGFRWNTRHMDDGERIVSAIRLGEGKRLLYREPKVV